MKQNSRGPSLISAFPHYGVPLDWGSIMTSENCLWVQKALGMHVATSSLAARWELEVMIPEG